MKTVIIAICIVFIFNKNYAQNNLVPNPSFEDTITLNPTEGSFIQNFIPYWNGWVSIYFNSLIVNSYAQTPSNYIGFQNPRTGNAYAAVKTASILLTQKRTYIQTRLKEELQTGKKYCIKIYASLGDSCLWANNSLQVYLSNDSIDATSTHIIDVEPQINFFNHPSLNNKTDWVELTDTLISNGTEKWIIIGNFSPDSISEIILLEDTCYSSSGGTILCQSHYYIDDVSVTLINESGIENIEANNFSIFPNPAKDVLTLKMQNSFSGTIKISSAVGKEIYNTNIPNNVSKLAIDIQDFATGIYFVSFYNEFGLVNKKFVKQ